MKYNPKSNEFAYEKRREIASNLDPGAIITRKSSKNLLIVSDSVTSYSKKLFVRVRTGVGKNSKIETVSVDRILRTGESIVSPQSDKYHKLAHRFLTN